MSNKVTETFQNKTYLSDGCAQRITLKTEVKGHAPDNPRHWEKMRSEKQDLHFVDSLLLTLGGEG